jgi:hypothetical protein
MPACSSPLGGSRNVDLGNLMRHERPPNCRDYIVRHFFPPFNHSSENPDSQYRSLYPANINSLAPCTSEKNELSQRRARWSIQAFGHNVQESLADICILLQYSRMFSVYYEAFVSKIDKANIPDCQAGFFTHRSLFY